MDIDIRFEAGSWDERSYNELANGAIKAALKAAPYPFNEGEVSLVFADDAFVQVLNRDYRGKDKPTNVLSFPQLEPEEIKALEAQDYAPLGDIILAYETLEREAVEQDKPIKEHCTHLIIHGLLHLLGYDHIEDEEAEEMEALEIKILSGLNIKNPYESGNFMA